MKLSDLTFENTVVIYHKNCLDGMAAATVVYDYLKENGYWKNFLTNKFIPAQYGDSPPFEKLENKTVIIVDFSYNRENLFKIKEIAKELVVLDHHKTAEEDLKDLDFCIFDMKNSGASLTWKFFHPEDDDFPLLIEFVEDRDLWLWKCEGTAEVTAYLQTLNTSQNESNLNFLDDYRRFFDDVVCNSLIEKGSAILSYQQAYVDKIVSVVKEFPDNYLVKFEGVRVPLINSTSLQSEIGAAISPHFPFVIIYFDTNDKRVFSLRSWAGSLPEVQVGVDVSAIAKKYGGGGHKHAAGFSIKLDKNSIIEMVK